MKAFIRGAGVVGGFGCGLSSLAEAIRRQQDPGSAARGSSAKTEILSGFTARTDLLERFVPPRTLRRVDHYGRMAILASHLALEDAGMKDGLPGDTGLIVATGMGPTANTLDLHPVDAAATDLALSPIVFSNSVHNAAAAYISMLLKIQGPSLSINQYEMSVPLAFQTAIDWLDEGRTGTVLVGSVDCFSKALQEIPPIDPDPKNPNRRPRTVPVGEGSAFFLLTRSEGHGMSAPFVQNVHLREDGRLPAPPIANLPLLLDGNDERDDLENRFPGHVSFEPVYGTFPTSTAMDVAAAVLFLRTPKLLRLVLPLVDNGPVFQAEPLIGCLKKGESGDWGMIVIGRSTFEIREY